MELILGNRPQKPYEQPGVAAAFVTGPSCCSSKIILYDFSRYASEFLPPEARIIIDDIEAEATDLVQHNGRSDPYGLCSCSNSKEKIAYEQENVSRLSDELCPNVNSRLKPLGFEMRAVFYQVDESGYSTCLLVLKSTV